jgi:hypothetical protein
VGAYGSSLGGQGDWGVRLPTHLVPRLGICGTVPLVTHAFSWRGARLSAETHFYHLHLPLNSRETRDSSVGIALGYRLHDRGPRVRFPAAAGNFSLHHRVQNGSEAYPASYPMGIRGSFPGGKAAGA